jgi:hypothetical protein
MIERISLPDRVAGELDQVRRVLEEVRVGGGPRGQRVPLLEVGAVPGQRRQFA